ncbi:dual-specificity protein phosphatase [Toxoplasma gondii RUB]|uniref:protein-tyrosine-phosphatase n=13 Tax=Toxoplasma gondii TaxID=5811 RepID=A0A125YZC3_TOXGV|nr:dual-specificity protein phosphatase [Toxoplasma gondii GT1]ESS30949.1 dual-specificity protein phosphatase [Toxoplasma gondii VEG]KAF4640243.1 dual-specificity protein phosphatase [Toxoplasma gondii]KFG62465.1 dual-specificity protein phosphatase [Toxoplasma gondii RUB]KFH07414.1 dual-specificity protein phosphatase [Toxoplasma gondii VAND]
MEEQDRPVVQEQEEDEKGEMKREAEEDEDTEETGQIPNVSSQSEAAVSMYACRRCRRVLFADEHIVPHSKVEKLASAVGPSPTKQRSCNMAFVEPLTWMGDVHEMTGKLLCPTERCKAKLGVWSWHGLPCNCGQWHCPAFQIQLRRVDNLPRSAEADSLEIQNIL